MKKETQIILEIAKSLIRKGGKDFCFVADIGTQMKKRGISIMLPLKDYLQQISCLEVYTKDTTCRVRLAADGTTHSRLFSSSPYSAPKPSGVLKLKAEWSELIPILFSMDFHMDELQHIGSPFEYLKELVFRNYYASFEEALGVYADDGSVLFHTGLFGFNSPIYGVLYRYMDDYYLNGFKTSDQLKQLSVLPKRARFGIDRIGHYNPEKMSLEKVHIPHIEKRCGRLPSDILKSLLGVDVQEYRNDEDVSKAVYKIIQNDPRKSRVFRSMMSGALHAALARAEQCPAVVEIGYSCKHGASFLLPVGFQSDVDCVLVIQVTDNGEYIGRSILRPEDALVNVRCIGQPLLGSWVYVA